MIYPSFNMYRSIGYIENYFNNILIWDNSVLSGAIALRERTKHSKINTFNGVSRLMHYRECSERGGIGMCAEEIYVELSL